MAFVFFVSGIIRIIFLTCHWFSLCSAAYFLNYRIGITKSFMLYSIIAVCRLVNCSQCSCSFRLLDVGHWYIYRIHVSPTDEFTACSCLCTLSRFGSLRQTVWLKGGKTRKKLLADIKLTLWMVINKGSFVSEMTAEPKNAVEFTWIKVKFTKSTASNQHFKGCIEFLPLKTFVQQSFITFTVLQLKIWAYPFDLLDHILETIKTKVRMHWQLDFLPFCWKKKFWSQNVGHPHGRARESEITF